MKHKKSLRNLLFSSLTLGFAAACTPATEQSGVIRTPAPTQQSVSTINFYGPVTEQRTNDFLSRFNHIKQRSNSIQVNIRSTGGLSTGARQMRKALEDSGRNIYMSCEGLTASAGATLFITTETENRNASANCRIMIHSPYYKIPRVNGRTASIEFDEMADIAKKYENSAPDTSVTLSIQNQTRLTLPNSRLQHLFDTLTKKRQSLANDLAEHSRLTTRDINGILSSGDVYFTPEETVFVGFADTINGRAPSQSELANGKQKICTRAPNLSVCR